MEDSTKSEVVYLDNPKLFTGLNQMLSYVLLVRSCLLVVTVMTATTIFLSFITDVGELYWRINLLFILFFCMSAFTYIRKAGKTFVETLEQSRVEG